MLGTWKAKLIAAGVVLLGILLAVLKIFTAGKRAGGSAERQRQQKAADKAKDTMNKAKRPETDSEVIDDMRDGTF